MSSVQDRSFLSSSNVALAVTAVVSLLAGFFLGQVTGNNPFGSGTASRGARRQKQAPTDGKNDDLGASSDDDDIGDDVLASLGTFPSSTEECKLVLVVRTDLGMTKGMSCTWHRRGFVAGITSPIYPHFAHSQTPLLVAQARSPRSALTRPFPATKRCFAIRMHPSYAAGSDRAR